MKYYQASFRWSDLALTIAIHGDFDYANWERKFDETTPSGVCEAVALVEDASPVMANAVVEHGFPDRVLIEELPWYLNAEPMHGLGKATVVS